MKSSSRSDRTGIAAAPTPTRTEKSPTHAGRTGHSSARRRGPWTPRWRPSGPMRPGCPDGPGRQR
ncbi:hypothetical protein HMPREF9586_00076 [Cutibacterium acnes HL083PA2]|nr:hypothetical protein HMPREF9586_00076 [Cutibacterium acnes HL083PA2]